MLLAQFFLFLLRTPYNVLLYHIQIAGRPLNLFCNVFKHFFLIRIVFLNWLERYYLLVNTIEQLLNFAESHLHPVHSIDCLTESLE